MRRVNVQNFPKNSRKTGFVSTVCDKTSIVASKSSSLSATQSVSQSVSQSVIEPVSQSIGQ